MPKKSGKTGDANKLGQGERRDSYAAMSYKRRQSNLSPNPYQKTVQKESSIMKIKRAKQRLNSKSPTALFSKRHEVNKVSVEKIMEAFEERTKAKTFTSLVNLKKSISFMRYYSIRQNYSYCFEKKQGDEVFNKEYYDFMLKSKETELKTLRKKMNYHNNLPTRSLSINSVEEIRRLSVFDDAIFKHEEEKVGLETQISDRDLQIKQLNKQIEELQLNNEQLNEKLGELEHSSSRTDAKVCNLQESINSYLERQGGTPIQNKHFSTVNEKLDYLICEILEKRDAEPPKQTRQHRETHATKAINDSMSVSHNIFSNEYDKNPLDKSEATSFETSVKNDINTLFREMRLLKDKLNTMEQGMNQTGTFNDNF